MNLIIEDPDAITDETKIRQIVNELVDYIVDYTCQLEIREHEKPVKNEINCDDQENLLENEKNSFKLDLEASCYTELNFNNLKFHDKHTKEKLTTDSRLTEEQLAVFEEAFKILDKDSNGFITLQELREVMNALGYCPKDEYIRQKIKDVDYDNSGTIDLEEFVCMMSKARKIKSIAEIEEEYSQIFKIFDINNDGYIDQFELKDILTKLGEKVTEEEVLEMIKEADTDKDNKVSFSEFWSILHDSKAISKLSSLL